MCSIKFLNDSSEDCLLSELLRLDETLKREIILRYTECITEVMPPGVYNDDDNAKL